MRKRRIPCAKGWCRSLVSSFSPSPSKIATASRSHTRVCLRFNGELDPRLLVTNSTAPSKSQRRPVQCGTEERRRRRRTRAGSGCRLWHPVVDRTGRPVGQACTLQFFRGTVCIRRPFCARILLCGGQDDVHHLSQEMAFDFVCTHAGDDKIPYWTECPCPLLAMICARVDLFLPVGSPVGLSGSYVAVAWVYLVTDTPQLCKPSSSEQDYIQYLA
ncbi:uncharacterized protein B0H18DRAFT_992887 [Fomitopsis serialis]|uniref:uncharacterized protein n=1 Tax=Fomitopsis serialis TaxID=139415 RepID=UPI002008CDE4|nr:uncharacterized protein B0H18DRAFT_992887 [Neoantrodia serialis]KAH9930657.1 hypothetical protein B0H18DRAFT_992887 [Neoantrodia serialis]